MENAETYFYQFKAENTVWEGASKNNKEVTHQISVKFRGAKPTAGRLSVYIKPIGSNAFFEVLGGQNLDITGGIFFVFTSNVLYYKFVLTGIVGGGGDIVIADTASNNPISGFLGKDISEIDRTTNALKIVDYPHSEVHNKNHYFCLYSFEIANGGTLHFIFVTPDSDQRAHILFATSVTGEANISLFRGVTADNDGTELDIINSDDAEDTNVSGVTITRDPTNPVGTTDLLNGGAKIGSGRGIGGMSRSEEEIKLRKNTRYLLSIRNDISGGTNIATHLFTFYMHTDKNQ